MNIARYKANTYSGNAAIVVDGTSMPKMLLGDNIEQIDDSYAAYMMFINKGMYDYDVMFRPDYTVFTVDMLGYRDLYYAIGEELRPMFSGYASMVAELLEQDMSMVMQRDTCNVNVISTAQMQSIPVYLNKYLDMRKTFKRNSIVMTRLVNIAMPNELAAQVEGFYAALPTKTSFDGTHETKSILSKSKQTYDFSDFKYLQLPVGQRAIIRKRPELSINIVVKAFDTYDKILCADASIENVIQLEGVCKVTELSEHWQLDFPYNPNREYIVTANAVISTQQALPTTTIQVVGADMLEHARLANALYLDKYIVTCNQSKPNKYTLPATYESKEVYRLHLLDWKTGDYNYDDFTAACTYGLIGSTYRFIPVQSDNRQVNVDWFTKKNVAYAYGNLHTFMLETVVSKRVIADYDFHTTTPIHETDVNSSLDTALANIELPTIYDGVVTFRNITYTLQFFGKKTNDFDGKKFAVVLRHSTNNDNYKIEASIAYSANYCALILTMDLTELLRTVNKPSTDDLNIHDFYIANMVELLPHSIAFYANRGNGAYGVQINPDASDLDMSLPWIRS